MRVLRTTVLRLERHLAALGLTDGMLAAVITVMVLELNIPHDASLAAFAGPAVSAEPDVESSSHHVEQGSRAAIL